MKCKVSWKVKIKPLFRSGKDNERVLFCQPVIVWKEAVAFPQLFLYRPRDLAPSVLKVRNVDLNALLERTDFVLFPFSGVPLSASPAFLGFPREGLRRILCRRGAVRGTDFGVGTDLVVG